MFQPKAKKPSVQEVSQRVDQSMARPGPSVRAEDLSQAPFAGNIDLIAPTKYRYITCVLLSEQHVKFTHKDSVDRVELLAECNLIRTGQTWRYRCLQST